MSRRAELKENVLAAQLEGVIGWATNNWRILAGVAGAVAAGLLVLSVVVLRNQQRREQNTTTLAQAQQLIGQKKYDDAIKILDQIRSQPANNNLFALATYYRGVAALETKNNDDAIRFFSEASERSVNSPLRPIALSNLGFAYEQKKDMEGAARVYGDFVAHYSDHFLAPRIQLALGRTLLAAGKNDDGRKALSQLIDLYPTSEWADAARSLMDKK